MFEYARYYPAWGAKKIFNLTLPIHQEKILRDIWFNSYVIDLCSRRTGKTFIAGGVAPVMQCALFPRTTVGIVAPTFREAQISFREVEELYNMVDMLPVITDGDPKHGSTAWVLEFKNGSSIMAVPMGRDGDGIRGEGFNYLFFDEYNYAANPNKIVTNVLAPMLFTKKGLKSNRKPHPMAKSNKFVIASTAGFAGTDYHKKVQEYQKKIKEGNNKYAITSFDYRDGLDSGIFEEEKVLEEYKNADGLTKKMEYENVFVDGSNGYINYNLLTEKAIDQDTEIDEDGNPIPPKTQIEFEGEPGYEYILAFDDADSYDNFAIAVIKLDNKVKRLVYLTTEKNVHVTRKERLLREIVRDFNVVRIVGDQRHRNITDTLAAPRELEDGTLSPCILKIEDYEEELSRVRTEYGSEVPYELLIDIHNFTAKTNEQRARLFRNEIEKGRFRMPSETWIENEREELAYIEIKKAINEIIMIEPKATGRFVKYQPSSNSIHKDRFTVCELGNWCAEQYLKEHMGEVVDVDLGGWHKFSH